MGKKIKMQVDNHLNGGARYNHDRRQVERALKESSKKITIDRGKGKIGGDGYKLGR